MPYKYYLYIYTNLFYMVPPAGLFQPWYLSIYIFIVICFTWLPCGFVGPAKYVFGPIFYLLFHMVPWLVLSGFYYLCRRMFVSDFSPRLKDSQFLFSAVPFCFGFFFSCPGLKIMNKIPNFGFDWVYLCNIVFDSTKI